MDDIGTLAAFALAILLLVVMTMNMNAETIALVSGIVVFFLVCRHKSCGDPIKYGTFNAMNDAFDASSDTDTSLIRPAADNSPIFSGSKVNPDVFTKLNASQRPEAPAYPKPDDAARARISKSNALAVGELYGRRSTAGTMDAALYVHKQRIGDRDRQATINQIRGRRANTYESYYRQELSEAERSGGWWKDNDDVLVTKLEKRQIDSIDMGRFSNGDSDLDGTYGQY